MRTAVAVLLLALALCGGLLYGAHHHRHRDRLVIADTLTALALYGSIVALFGATFWYLRR